MKRKLYYKLLNIAAGKFEPLIIKDLNSQEKYFLVNLDTMYADAELLRGIETYFESWVDHYRQEKPRYKLRCKEDAFEFMERISFKFDYVSIYRFLEHVSFTQVEYFIYLISTITEPGSLVDVIVPDYTLLANMIYEDDPWDQDFHAKNILLTTELLNEPSCPHASIWTEERARYFWELEGRFKVQNIKTPFEFDGRNIYLRFQAERV